MKSTRITFQSPVLLNAATANGSILVVVTLMMFLLLCVAGLVVDFAMLSEGNNKQSRVADYAALAALKGYYDAVIPTGTPQVDEFHMRQQAALTAAANISGLKRNLLSVDRFTRSSRAEDTPLDLTLELIDPAKDGRIISGTWWPVPPDSCTPGQPFCDLQSCTAPNCDYPCGDGTKPCFRPTQAGELTANAFSVELWLRSGNLYRTRLMNIIGSETAQVRSRAFASLTPRRLDFVIDTSPSVSFVSHPRRPIVGFDPARGYVEYAMRLSGAANGCGPGGVNTCRCTGGHDFNPCAGGACRFLNASFNSQWLLLPESNPAAISKDDYKCITANYEVVDWATGVSTSLSEDYLIDIKQDPQPLTQILSAVRSALDVFLERGVPADRVGVMFFDQDRIPQREFDLTAPEYSNSDFQNFYRITNTDRNSATWTADFYERAEQRIAMPRDPSSGEVFTDAYPFVDKARTDLATLNGASLADNSIALVTDGFLNCNRAGVCDDFFGTHDEAIGEFINGTLSNELARQQIPLHIVLIGSTLMNPHTLLAKSFRTGSECLSELEARLDTRTFVLHGSDAPDDVDTCYPHGGRVPAGCSGNYYYPNQIYLAAKKTGGLFIPVRQPCTDTAGGADCADEVKTVLTTACGSRGDNLPIPNVMNGINRYTDGRGRLICSPDCRTESQQLTDAFERILGNSPYVLVAEQPS